ncbi:hypothetical protein [Wohlfahrtiimonas larvae]|uniref:Uncharacterized protein n=1 Tax=Wohlfahrtiimonas larvae TaxID=1157986 RepID=A0ABP9MH67_9GAMM|nr:hypothetical protein [Wohlfahrtiimonas larvae]
MDGKQRVLVEALLVFSFIISIMLIFFPSEVPVRRAFSFLYIHSPFFPYARVIFPIFTILLYILRKQNKDELSIEQKMALWSDKKRDQ